MEQFIYRGDSLDSPMTWGVEYRVVTTSLSASMVVLEKVESNERVKMQRETYRKYQEFDALEEVPA